MTMNRREFFLNLGRTAGAAALVSALGEAHLLAVPDDPGLPYSGWHWDGSPEDYLDRLNHLTLGYLRREGVSLEPWEHEPEPRPGDVTIIGPEPFHYWTMLGAAWKLPLSFKFGERSSPAPRESQMVYTGEAACFNGWDPVASIDVTARQFADRIVEIDADTFGLCELPYAVQIARRDRLFRMVVCYDLYMNQELMRVDTIVGQR